MRKFLKSSFYVKFFEIPEGYGNEKGTRTMFPTIVVSR